MHINHKQLKSFIKHIIQENNPPQGRPPKQKAAELLDAGLTALDSAIDLFHKAMDADSIFFEKTNLLPQTKDLEDKYDDISQLSPNPISQWGSLPGEDHRPVDTGRYNPQHIDLHHPKR